MNIDNLTLGELKQIAALTAPLTHPANTTTSQNPMIGRRCIVRTYSAGVHIGTVISVDEMNVHLKDALRLWKWEDGGLSLSAIATNGVKKARLNRTPEVWLTNAIELIPVTDKAWDSYENFIED